MTPTPPHDLDAARRLLARDDIDPLALQIMQMMKSHAGMMEQRRAQENVTPVKAYALDYAAAEEIVAAVLIGGE